MAGASKYNPAYHDDWAWSLAMKGATDQEVADAFGVAARTVNRWKADHVSFRKKLEEGKSGANAKVEVALYRRATGYESEETESLLEMDASGNQRPLRVKKVKKQVPPDTMAIMYFLNNRARKSGEWAQKQDVGVSIDNKQDVVIYLPEIESEGDG